MVPEDVERFVTRYVEQSVNGATGVLRVRSSSGMGLSIVYVEFDWGTDIYRNRQIVQEKLQLAAGHLPEGVTPHMAPISSLMGQIQLVGVSSKTGETDPSEIRALVDQSIKLRLLSISGVAQVTASGGAPRQLQVIVDADKLRAQRRHAPGGRARRSGTPTSRCSGGLLPMGAKGPVITVTGLVQETEDLELAVVRHDEIRPVRLADVGEVRFGPSAIRDRRGGRRRRQGRHPHGHEAARRRHRRAHEAHRRRARGHPGDPARGPGDPARASTGRPTSSTARWTTSRTPCATARSSS